MNRVSVENLVKNGDHKFTFMGGTDMIPALLTDLYELTMLAGYQREEMLDRPASFELFFREPPFGGGYAVFAGLQPALEYLAKLAFSEEDLRYLASFPFGAAEKIRLRAC